MDISDEDKENIGRCKYNGEASNKENIPIRPKTSSRHSTGAIRKTNQQSSNRYHSYNQEGSSARQPLADLNQNQRQKSNLQKHEKFDGFKKPTAVVRNRRTRNTTFIKEKAHNKILESSSGSVDKTSSPESFSSTSDDSTFWSSFITINNTFEPHVKKITNFKPVRKANEVKFQNKHNHSIIHDSIPSLRRKTLKRQVSKSSGYLGVVNLDLFTNPLDPTVLYTLDYMNDIVFHIINKQKENILKPELLNKENIFLDQRASVINWMIKLHQYLVSEAGVFFMSVRLFDKILTLVAIPESYYQLTAIAAYWISAKYSNSSNFVTARKLVKLCNNAFSAKGLFEMEKTIFLILQFDVVLDDPIVFIYYYIYILQLIDSNMIAFCANYLLELLTLDINCNTFSLPLQAASAVFLSLKFFNIKEKVWNSVEKYFGYHHKSEMYEVHKIMIKNLILTNDEDCPYKESLRKYSTERYGKVSVMIPQILARWYHVNDISLLAF